MQTEETNFFDWQECFASEAACGEFLAKQRWPEGFICPQCGHEHALWINSRRVYQCAHRRHQVSVTVGTLFYASKLPLRKWFWANYLVVTDKGGISALRLSKLLDVSWSTAYRMLRKLRVAMGHRDSLYRLANWIELDDAFIDGKWPGKGGRGAEGKTPILVACEDRGEQAGFLAMEVTESVSAQHVKQFAARHLKAGQTVFTDALPTLNALTEEQLHCPRVTPPEQGNCWLLWVHVAIAKLKRYLLGTYHGVTATYLQGYPNEFCYCFNRRFWEPQLPMRLLSLCVNHAPVKLNIR